jgi:5-methylcytosine-specific restriction endonuclease McrA
MIDVLNRPCLLLNKNYQAISEKTVGDAMVMLNSENPHFPGMPVGMGVIVDGEVIQPVTWEEWITLPPMFPEYTIHTPRLTLRAPTVIMAVNFKHVPKKRPNMCPEEIYRRDKHRCQYTGKKLDHTNRSLDHIHPRSRGGQNNFRNVVACDKSINLMKGDRTPEEAGLKLLSRPKEPLPIPFVARIPCRHPDWERFLIK